VVVRNKSIREAKSVTTVEGGLILMTSEPESVVTFPQRYCEQFDIVYTSQKSIRHRNLIVGPPLLPWFVGVENIDGESHYRMSYEDVRNADLREKRRLMSVITSDKAFTAGHRARLRFVKRLKEHFGDKIEIFGRGYREIGDKWEALLPYRYHIAIENSARDDYWTEKLGDAYLAGCHPIYYGCANIKDYFDQCSTICIDINDPDKAIETIEKAIEEDVYEANSRYVRESREKCLDRYNMFSIIADVCDKAVDIERERRKKTIRPARTLGSNIARYCVERPVQKILHLAEKIMGKTLS